MTKPDTTATVFFNSACPVCKAGIESQRSNMQACSINFVDIHQSPEAAQAIGASVEAIRERLYVQDENGKLYIGADAFAELSRRSPGKRWLGQLIRWPLLNRLAHLAYNAFAHQLYRWNRRKGHW